MDIGQDLLYSNYGTATLYTAAMDKTYSFPTMEQLHSIYGQDFCSSIPAMEQLQSRFGQDLQ